MSALDTARRAALLCDVDATLAHLARALGADVPLVTLHRRFGELMAEAGHVAHALHAWGQVHAALRVAGHDAAALRVARQASDLSPADVHWRLRLVRGLLREGHLDAALDVLDEGVYLARSAVDRARLEQLIDRIEGGAAAA